jgi:hypothetical protein
MQVRFLENIVLRKSVSVFLVSALLLSHVVYFFTKETYALTQRTWSTAEDFNEGTLVDTVAPGGYISLAPDETASSSLVDTSEEHFLRGYGLYEPLSMTKVNSNNTAVVLADRFIYSGITALKENGTILPGDGAGTTYFHASTSLLYIAGSSGVWVFETNGTDDPQDDVYLRSFSTATSPALPSNSVRSFGYENGLLYVGTGGGVAVIDTGDNDDPDDDVLVTTYTTASSPAIAHNSVSELVVEDGVLYIGNTNGLSIIDTQGTVAPGDDVLLITYSESSSPALLDSNVTSVLKEGDILYVGLNDNTIGGPVRDGLVLIDTQGTAAVGDDTLLITYNNTNLLTIGAVNDAFLDSNGLLYIGGYFGDIDVVDTQGTSAIADDVLVGTYNGDIDPEFPTRSGPLSAVGAVDGIVYVGTFSGFFTIDTNGTESLLDDEVHEVGVDLNSTAEDCSIADIVVASNGLVYVGGCELAVINATGDSYYPSTNGTYIGPPQRVSTMPSAGLSFERGLKFDQYATSTYRTGSADAVWFDDFATTSSYAGDIYGWGSSFQSVSVVDGVLTLSDPEYDGGGDASDAMVDFDTGKPDNFFPEGSLVQMRFKVNDPGGVGGATWMTLDEWESSLNIKYIIHDNEWVVVNMIADAPFSTVSLNPFFNDLAWPEGEVLEIDWIQITTPDSFGEWNDWTGSCTGEVCGINPDDLAGNTWFQYRVDMATDDELTTPSIQSVSYLDSYVTSGTYTSEEIAVPANTKPLSMNISATIPASTTIAFEYSGDGGETWTSMSQNETFPDTFRPNTFMWRTTMETASTTLSPLITSAQLTFTSNGVTVHPNGSITLEFGARSATDDTRDDFLSGNTNPSSGNTTGVTSDEEVVLGTGRIYTTHSNPNMLNSAAQTIAYDADANLLYVGTGNFSVGGGVTVIDTHGTFGIEDDEVVAEYTTATTPAIGNDFVRDLQLEGELLYVSTYGGGLSVIDTQGTPEQGDDTVFTYTTATSPAIGHDVVYHSNLTEDGLLYVGTGGGLSVIDTQGTESTADDTLVFTYRFNTTPAIGNDDAFYSERDGDLLYVATYFGLTVIDTQGTVSAADDTLIIMYDDESTPAIGGGSFTHVDISEDGILTISSRFGVDEGVYVIDTQGTVTPADDVLLGSYTATTDISITGAYHTQRDGDLLYISTYAGLVVIDTQGTDSIADDELYTIYNQTSNPRTGGNWTYGSSIVGSELYINQWYGLTVIDLDGAYQSSGLYQGAPQRISDTPTTTISYTGTTTDDHTVTIQYRTGGEDAVWFDDFSSTANSYVGDYYDWGDYFQSSTTEDSVLTLSNPSDDYYAVAVFHTGKEDDYFPAGSVVQARIRVNIEDESVMDFEDWMFTDDWEDGDVYYNVQNEWVIVTLIPSLPFADIGFNPYMETIPDGDGGWGDEESFQIDWLRITTPDSFGEWNDWSDPCTETVCAIDPDDVDGETWIQYQVTLETDNEETTPTVDAVSYSSGYEAYGVYTSENTEVAENQRVVSFEAESETPDGTSIVYEYSTDEGETWMTMEEEQDFADSFSPTEFMWRAILESDDPTVTPTITSVTLTLTAESVAQRTVEGTLLVKKRVAELEAQGKYIEAGLLRQKYPHLFADTPVGTPAPRVLEQIVLLLKEIVVKLEMIAEIRAQRLIE